MNAANTSVRVCVCVCVCVCEKCLIKGNPINLWMYMHAIVTYIFKYLKRLNLYIYIYIYRKRERERSTERYLTGVKSAGFRSQLEVSCVSSHTEELWYNEKVCLWMTVYMLPLGLSTLAWNYSCHVRVNIKLFSWTPVAVS